MYWNRFVDQLELLRVELLGFDQDLFPHTDFAEIVQDRRVANLANVLRA